MEIFVILVAFLDADERPIQNHFDNGGCVQILPRERNGGRNIKVIKIVAFSYRDNGGYYNFFIAFLLL